MTEPTKATERNSLPDVSPQQAAACLLAFYSLGFIVSNAHYAHYETTRTEILQTRYISAALLFIVAIGFPVVCGMLGCRALATYYNRRTKAQKDPTLHAMPERRYVVLAMALVYLVGFTMYYSVGQLIVVNPSVWRMVILYSFGYFGAHLHAEFRQALASPKEIKLDRESLLYLRGIESAITLTVVIAAAVMFGAYGYKNVDPAFGGGAAWYGRLGFTTSAKRDMELQIAPTGMTLGVAESGDEILREVLANHVILIDRDQTQTTFLMCNRHRKRSVSVTVPTSAVAWQNTIGLVSVSNAASWLCGAPPPDAEKSLFEPRDLDPFFIKK